MPERTPVEGNLKKLFYVLIYAGKVDAGKDQFFHSRF
jgi:hypothetical protein